MNRAANEEDAAGATVANALSVALRSILVETATAHLPETLDGLEEAESSLEYACGDVERYAVLRETLLHALAKVAPLSLS